MRVILAAVVGQPQARVIQRKHFGCAEDVDGILLAHLCLQTNSQRKSTPKAVSASLSLA